MSSKDIIMCGNPKGQCELEKVCYRRLCKPNEYHQSYAIFGRNKQGQCEGYWTIDTKLAEETKRLKRGKECN
jgi:hypothetical protein